MKQRERILASVVGAMLVIFVGNWLFQAMLQGPLDERRSRGERLRKDIEKKEGQLRLARAAGEQLTAWQRQSLPTDLELARSLYQNWLLELVRVAGFAQPNVDSGETVGKKDIYQKLPFTVRGQGTLEQLTSFLYNFYRADHLHQVQRLSITPIPRSQQLELSMSIEALVLPDGERKDRLSGRTSDRLAAENLVEYRAIVERNLFGEGGARAYDESDFAFLTAILEVGGQLEAWFTIRTTGEILKLNVGQPFQVGQFRGRVAEIDSLDVVIDSDNERWLLTLGENLSQATALPPEL